MKVRFYVDPESGEPHVGLHAVGEEEVRNVLARPLEDRPGRDGSRVALGQTAAGGIFESSMFQIQSRTRCS